jgi:glycosyltransferase involved in cell wall biosynthesis
MYKEQNLNIELITEPLISVIIPIYNSESYVGEALESIINQAYKNLEIILVDDGSTDKSLVIVEKYAESDKRIVILRNGNNSGIVVSLNKGISYCHGKYVARMDSDDWSFPYRISKQVEFLEKNPDVVICGGSIEIVDVNMKHLNYRLYPLTDKKVRSVIFMFSPYAHPSVMYRAEAVRKAGLYDNSFLWAEDYDLYFRLGMIGKFSNLHEPLLKLRTHKNSVSQTRLKKQELMTLLVRFKSWISYGYPLTFFNLIYSIAQLVGVFVIPVSIKFKLFNFLRSSKKI